jgi:hypothetical protein
VGANRAGDFVTQARNTLPHGRGSVTSTRVFAGSYRAGPRGHPVRERAPATKLKPSGANLAGRCPFHEERLQKAVVNAKEGRRAPPAPPGSSSLNRMGRRSGPLKIDACAAASWVRIITERVCNARAGPPILIQHLKIGGPARHALVSKLLAVRRKGEA